MKMVASRFCDFIAIQDQRLMRRLNSWNPPRWVRLWMMSSSRAGDGWLWAGLLIAILWHGGNALVVAVSAIAASCGIGLFLALKRLTDRQRPCTIEPICCWARLVPPDRFSFPSGHSIVAFAVTTPLSLSFPDYTLVLVFCGVSVSISRVVLGLHFLSDVIAGSVMGAAIGYTSYTLLV
jgi:undecaprenyl-diphosphatase